MFEGCGGKKVITEESTETIASPSFSTGSYLNNVECMWFIHVYTANKKIRVKLVTDTFDLETHHEHWSSTSKKCDTNFISVSDWSLDRGKATEPIVKYDFSLIYHVICSILVDTVLDKYRPRSTARAVLWLLYSKPAVVHRSMTAFEQLLAQYLN